jgi:hypothetical protein
MSSRTGRYKLISIIGAISSTSAYLLMMFRWNGNTSFAESLYIIGGGFGNGISLSTSFVALTAGVQPTEMAIASSGLYLSSNIGTVGGLSIAAALFQSTLRSSLRLALEGIDGREEVWLYGLAVVYIVLIIFVQIMNKALTDIAYVQSLKGHIGALVVRVYVKCLEYTHGKTTSDSQASRY